MLEYVLILDHPSSLFTLASLEYCDRDLCPNVSLKLVVSAGSSVMKASQRVTTASSPRDTAKATISESSSRNPLAHFIMAAPSVLSSISSSRRRRRQHRSPRIN